MTDASDDAELCNDLRCLHSHSSTSWLDQVKERSAARIEQLAAEVERLDEYLDSAEAKREIAEAALSERIESHKVCLDMVRELRERNIKNGKIIAALFALLNERGWTDDDIDRALAAKAT